MQQQQIKVGADMTASVITGGALLGWLPHISAVLGILWFAIQITEKFTGKPFSELVRCAYRHVRGK